MGVGSGLEAVRVLPLAPLYQAVLPSLWPESTSAAHPVEEHIAQLKDVTGSVENLTGIPFK